MVETSATSTGEFHTDSKTSFLLKEFEESEVQDEMVVPKHLR